MASFIKAEICGTHRNEKIQVVCETCELALCVKCMEEPHPGHKFIDKESAISHYKDKLKKTSQLIQTRLTEVKTQIKSISHRQQENVDEAQHILGIIQNKGELLKKEIDKIVEELSRQVEGCKKSNEEKLGAEKDEAEKQDAQLSCYLQQSKIEMDRNNIQKILTLNTEMTLYVDKGNYESSITQNALKFIPGNYNHGNIKAMFGSLQEIGENGNANENAYEYVEQIRPEPPKNENQNQTQESDGALQKCDFLFKFKVSEKGIASISPFKEDRAFLRDNSGKELKLVKENGSVIRSVPANTKKSDIAITSDGVVLITCPDRFCVKKFQSDGTVRVFIWTDDLSPYGISVHFETGTIFVALVDSWNYDVRSDSKRFIRKYSSSGDVLRSIECTRKPILGKAKPVIVSPYKVRVNQYNGDVGVVNWTSWHQGNVLVFNPEGNMKFTYPKRLTDAFEPHDITFDSRDHTVVADAVSKSLHLLNADGELLNVIYKCEHTPWSLGYFGKGKLWVGQSDGTVAAVQYYFD